jgi:Ion channel
LAAGPGPSCADAEPDQTSSSVDTAAVDTAAVNTNRRLTPPRWLVTCTFCNSSSFLFSCECQGGAKICANQSSGEEYGAAPVKSDSCAEADLVVHPWLAEPCGRGTGTGANIPTLLAKIPDEYKPLAALGIGAFVLVFLALFHGVGLHWIQVWQRRGERRLRLGRPHVIVASFLFGWSVFLMLVLHILEILIWAFGLTHLGLIEHAYDAIYYCANCYTTLGMGKVDVLKEWRELSPIIGISGLFTFAWTTSALVDVVTSNRRLLEQLEGELDREMHMRFALRKKEWDALKTEIEAEHAEEEKTKISSAGPSLVGRCRTWWEERKKVAELRKQRLAEIEDLLRRERLKEREIQTKAAASSPEDKEQSKNSH